MMYRVPSAWQELGGKNVNIDVYIRQRSWAKHNTRTNSCPDG